MTHEFDLINQLAMIGGDLPAEIPVGIGDDCAVWTVGGASVLLATDMLLEGVHFDLNQLSYEQVGRKSLAVNLSDVAAMGGKPHTALVSLAVPSKTTVDDLKRLMDGMMTLGQEYETSIIGGDTTSYDGRLVINVAITGVTDIAPILRSGAREGDFVFVTGALGGSLSGHHWSFIPRVREARQLVSRYKINSMIDVSDGLASDIRHIAQASVVGCVLDEQSIPISDQVDQNIPQLDRLHHAFSDGEDFELLFTTSAEVGESLLKQDDIEVHQIGRMQGTAEQILLKKADGTLVDLPDSGWKHSFQSK